MSPKIIILLLAITTTFSVAVAEDAPFFPSIIEDEGIADDDTIPFCKNEKEGDSCKKEGDIACGSCANRVTYYYQCEAINGDKKKLHLVKVTCPNEKWFNPYAKKTGFCVEWKSLTKAVHEHYLSDDKCVPDLICRFDQDKGDHCTSRYYKYDPKKPEGHKKEYFNCQGELIWDCEIGTCARREQVNGCHHGSDIVEGPIFNIDDLLRKQNINVL